MTEYEALKERQREIREGFPESLALRTHRALSWLDRAEREGDDDDARFLFLWIAFNAAYANELPENVSLSERRAFRLFLRKLIDLDKDKIIYRLVWDTFSSSIRLLIDNKFVYQPFWDYQNGKIGEEQWAERFTKDKAAAVKALGRMDTETILAVTFDRLYVLRNQLVHGGATWSSSVNRSQVHDGASFIGQIVPVVIHLMMENANAIWGDPCYPVVSS